MLLIEFLVSQICSEMFYLVCSASPTTVKGGMIQGEIRRSASTEGILKGCSFICGMVSWQILLGTCFCFLL